MDSHDLAYIAGFLEGEGTFAYTISDKGYCHALIRVTSTDEDVVQKLADRVPRSRTRGPYEPSKGSLGKKPVSYWTLAVKPLVVALATDIRPMMGQRRQGQIDKMLDAIASCPTLRVHGPAPHGTVTRWGQGCRCDVCHMASNNYQRDRRIARGVQPKPRVR